FTLRLPSTMRAIHPVFHVSMLEPHIPSSISNRVEPPPPEIEVEGESQYGISRVVDSKIDRRRHACKLLYKVIWLGYEDTDDAESWLPATELEHAMELVEDFHRSYPDKPGPLSSL